MSQPAGELGRRVSRRTKWAVAGAGMILALAAVPVAAPGLSGEARAASGCDWPMFQHDAQRTAAVPCQSISPLNVATLHPTWFFPDPNMAATTATPTVANGMVYVGDSSGEFFAIPQGGMGTVTAKWTFSVIKGADGCSGDHHQPSYGEITSSAAVANGIVYLGGGGTLYALDANSGSCMWAQDLDPWHKNSRMEIESSPMVIDVGAGRIEVVVGSDSNESPGSSAPPGIQAFDATTGAFKWKYEPENNQTVTTSEATSALTDGCGDVWTSPAYDPHTGFVIFSTGNCPLGTSASPNADRQGVYAVDGDSGLPRWSLPFAEPNNQYSDPNFPDGGDTDFGSSPIITSTVSGTPEVIEGSKSGYVYGLAEATGQELWQTQAAQPGELGTGPSAIGGFIGSAALGWAANPPVIGARSSTWFGATAIQSSLNGRGVGGLPGSVDTTMACGLENTTPQGVSASSIAATDPECLTRSASLHAVSAQTGQVLWQAPISLPSYAAVTYSNDVVFAPSTTGFSLQALDADTGTQLWAFPLGATVASGMALAGNSVFVGTGISESGVTVPGANGVWCFTTAV